MKKILFTLLFVIVLCLTYLGFTYYSSVIAKQKLITLLENTTSALSQNQSIGKNMRITLSQRETESGLFSSRHRIIITAVPVDQIALPSNQQDAIRYNLDLVIESGPFPVSNLSAFDFTPVLSKYTLDFPTSIVERSLLVRDPSIDRATPLATIKAWSSFSKDITISGEFIPFEYNDPKNPIKFMGGNFTTQVSSEDKILNFGANIHALDIKLDSPWIPNGHIIDAIVSQSDLSPRHQFKFDSFSINYESNPLHQNFILGDKQIDLKGFEFNISHYPILSLSDLDFAQQEIQRANITEIENNVVINNLGIYGLNFGSGDFKFISLHRSAQDVINFYNKSFEYVKSDNFKRTSINPNPSIDSFLASLESLLSTLEANPGYQISPFNWRNEKGQISINSEVLFTNNLSYQLGNTSASSPYQHINVFHIDVATSRGVVPQFITHLDQIMGIEASVAANKNDKLTEDNIDLLTNSGIIILTGDNLRFTFSYANNSFVLNGIPYSRSQMLEFIALVSLRQSGLLSPANLIKLNEYIASQTRSN